GGDRVPRIGFRRGRAGAGDERARGGGRGGLRGVRGGVVRAPGGEQRQQQDQRQRAHPGDCLEGLRIHAALVLLSANSSASPRALTGAAASSVLHGDRRVVGPALIV